MTITQAHQRKQKRLAEGHAPRLLDLFAGCGGISLGFESAGFEIIGGVDNPLREGLVSFALAGQPAADIVTRLNDRGIRTHTRKADHYSGNILDPLGKDSCVRVSLCHYNSEEEVARFLETMRDLAQEG